MYKVIFTSQFKKDVKKARKRGADLRKFEEVLEILVSGSSLEAKYRDHALSGNWVGFRELHIAPDWLLIYYIEDDILVLTLSRMGSHSDLFS